MKAAFLSFFAIGGFIASAIANPITVTNSVEKRQDYVELGVSLTTLLADIQKQTAIINSTLDTVTENPIDVDVGVDVSQIVPQLEAITDLLKGVNVNVVKRVFVEVSLGKLDVIQTVSAIIYEVLFTVTAILSKLGLGVITYLTPVILALKGLVFSLDSVVGGVLAVVGPIVNELLKAVGLVLISL
ncbi:hypothetical protein F4823DRAFT_563563 [Ustulina deusta]|nr:hypothetical protein F4823DRAFT_563563 [Ustulina deusta]